MLDDANTELHQMEYGLTLPIDVIYTSIEDLADYSELAGASMTQNQCIQKGYLIINSSGKLKSRVRDWNRLTQTQRNWTHFKITIAKAILNTGKQTTLLLNR
jgi:hypothetical protein